jgi:hypothetical protein
MKHVHRDCLDQWRATSVKNNAFTHCSTCNFEYVFEPLVDDPTKERDRINMYRYVMARDIFGFLLLQFAIMFCLTMFIRLCDWNKDLLHDFGLEDKDWFKFYFFCGFLLYMLIIGFFGLIIGANDLPNCNGGCVGGEGALIVCVIVAITILIFGILMGLGYAVKLLKDTAAKHRANIWKYQEAKKYIVKDLNDNEYEILNNV